MIPSHYDYPADAKDRLAKTAAGGHGPDQGHDPLRPRRGPGGARRDRPARRQGDQPEGSGQAGHPPRRLREGPGRLHHRQGDQGYRRGKRRAARSDYVRVPGQKRTYGVNVKADLSTKFADWIETNLLKVDTGKVRKVEVRQLQGRRPSSRRAPCSLPRRDADDRAQGLRRARGRSVGRERCPPARSSNTEKIYDLTDALGDLKIVGVRPKPAGLTATSARAQADQADAADRACRSRAKGFTSPETGLCRTRET